LVKEAKGWITAGREDLFDTAVTSSVMGAERGRSWMILVSWLMRWDIIDVNELFVETFGSYKHIYNLFAGHLRPDINIFIIFFVLLYA